MNYTFGVNDISLSNNWSNTTYLLECHSLFCLPFDDHGYLDFRLALKSVLTFY